jgi:branched-subunit amino acid transport protein
MRFFHLPYTVFAATGWLPAQMPNWFERAMYFVPISVLTPIIVHSVFITPDSGITLADNTRLPAAILAVLVALLTRSVIITLIGGFTCLWAISYFGL